MRAASLGAKMKKTTTVVTLVFLAVIIGIVGLYAYFSGKARDAADPASTAVQKALDRDLQNDYPPTVKEVVKYYTELQKCLYNEEYSEEEFEQMGNKSRQLYDRELLEANDETFQLVQLRQEIEAFRIQKCVITSISVAASTNVSYFEEDGYSFARILCKYTIRENGSPKLSQTIYLLRQDENRHWRIYGWEQAENVDNAG